MGLLLSLRSPNKWTLDEDWPKETGLIWDWYRSWKESKIMKKFTSQKSWSCLRVNHLSMLFFQSTSTQWVSCLSSCANNPSTWTYSWNVRIVESATQLQSILFIYKSALCKVLRGLAGELGYIGWHLLSRQLFPRWSRGSIDRNKHVALLYFLMHFHHKNSLCHSQTHSPTQNKFSVLFLWPDNFEPL